MRVWSEKNGRADVMVRGFTWCDYLVVALAGLIVLAGCIAVVGALS